MNEAWHSSAIGEFQSLGVRADYMEYQPALYTDDQPASLPSA